MTPPEAPAGRPSGAVVPAGVATGVGSLPLADPGEAARLVAGELPDFPHLPELPARGAPAGMIGRAAALLVDLPVDLQPAGWRLAPSGGLDLRRAQAALGHDLDALEEVLDGYTGPVKVQVAGPWTLAASIERPRGGPVLADPGAARDLAASLREGIAGHLAELRRRLPGAALVLQLDEPSLPAVLAGQVPTASGLSRVAPVEAPLAQARLAAQVADADALGVPVVVHCCAPGAPVGLLRGAGVAGVSVDATLPGWARGAGLDELAAAADAGLVLLLGLVPTDLPAGEAERGGASAARAARALWRALGFPASALAETVTITPTCGLAGASDEAARAAMAATRTAAAQLLDDPEDARGRQ